MKKYLKITIMFLIMLTIATTTVNATYQSRSGRSSATTTVDSYFYNIRKMEAEGQVLGLAEILKTDDSGEAETSSNNIDCHLMKNTEYGIMALFSASSFGNAPQGESSASTTQNATGIFQLANNNTRSGGSSYSEKLAAVNSDIGSNSSYCGKLRNSVNKKYVDIYNSTSSTDYSSVKVGDATKETASWYGADSGSFVYSRYPVLTRGYDALFNFSYASGESGTRTASRAVIVCGQGL